VAINRVEGIFLLTHGDGQHIGGAADTIADFAPREIYDNRLISVRCQTPVIGCASARENKTTTLIRGRFAPLWPNWHRRYFTPTTNIKLLAADDAPLIVQLVFDEEIRVLFESDAGAKAEALLETG